jgi:hypothetical protein
MPVRRALPYAIDSKAFSLFYKKEENDFLMRLPCFYSVE